MSAHPSSRSFWFVFIAGIAVMLLFGIAAVLLKVLVPKEPEDAARIAERISARQELMASNETRLGTYAWVDKAKGSVQIPIERAMELAIVRLANRPPEPAGPIDGAAPVSTPAAGSNPQATVEAEAQAEPKGEAGSDAAAQPIPSAP